MTSAPRGPLDTAAFLRSVNVLFDIDEPSRIAHFRPTSKSVVLLDTLLRHEEDRAVLVAAPYGSGKSLTATYLLQLVENLAASRVVLEAIQARLEPIDRNLAGFAQDRVNGGVSGLAIPLYGQQDRLPEAIKHGCLAALDRHRMGRQARTIQSMPCESMSDALSILETLRKKAKSKGLDRIVIVWDEFGRHLQSLLASGRPEDLDQLQLLAEYVSRTESPAVSLLVLLHRSLAGYADSSPTAIRREWAKIEGRFRSITYQDQSAELYRLLAEIVESRKAGAPDPSFDFGELAERAHEVGWFEEIGLPELASILRAAYPLEPASLFLLPRVAGRIAQHERTLFGFLLGVRLDHPIGPEAVYDYFENEFQSDRGIGGTQKRWLETESALLKAGGEPAQEKALKTCFLLGLGLGGERARAGMDQVVFGLSAMNWTGGRNIVDGLIQQGLLLHRRHTDQLLVWHGTDVDLAGRLEEEKARGSSGFDLIGFLREEAPPPVWRPVKHNAEFGIGRYFVADYVSLSDLAAAPSGQVALFPSPTTVPPGVDGRIYYLLSQGEAVSDVVEIVRSTLPGLQTIFAVVHDSQEISRAAFDLSCILRMMEDQELIASDPLVQAELDHLADDARKHLQNAIAKIHAPNGRDVTWLLQGEPIALQNATALRELLSAVMDQVFPDTPIIMNEMIVRRRPSPTIVNARKKVALGILESYGLENVGIKGDFADKAIFRGVFVRTGLYRPEGDRWAFARPDELDPRHRIGSAWGLVEDFLTTPASAPKSFTELIDGWEAPPIGLRRGVIPLFLAAGLQAFPSAISVMRRGEWVNDILPSVVEEIARTPGDFNVTVLELTEPVRTALAGLMGVFTYGSEPHEEPRTPDLVRQCADALANWRLSLPDSALKSSRLSQRTKRFQRAIVQISDPVALFLGRLPTVLEVEPIDDATARRFVEAARDCVTELQSVNHRYRDEAAIALGRSLAASGISNGNGLREQAERWAACFPGSVLARLPSGVPQATLRGMLRGQLFESEHAFLESLSQILIGQSLGTWDDHTVAAFDRAVRVALEDVEQAALSLLSTAHLTEDTKDGLALLLTGRLEDTVNKLSQLVGSERARGALANVIDTFERT